MLNWLKRIFGIGKANTNAALEKLENPITMIEQGLRELRDDLNKGIKSLAEIRGMAISAEYNRKEKLKLAEEYESKAMKYLKSAQNGEITEMGADRLAGDALTRKHSLDNDINFYTNNLTQYEELAAKVEANNKILKGKIETWEKELDTLKVRLKVAKTTKEFNQKMANLDTNNTMQLLENMRNKVSEEESLAEAFSVIKESNKSLDQRINEFLEPKRNPNVNDSLHRLKEKISQS